MSQTLLPNNPAFILAPPGIVPALGLDKTFTTADTSNGNSFLSSGRDLLIMYNSGGSPYTVVISSAPDPDGRFADVTYTIGAGVYSFVEINSSSVFIQATNLVLLLANNAAIQFLVVMNA